MRSEFITQSQTDYFADKAINCSTIKKALRSPAFLLVDEHKDSDAMQVGKAFHYRILEPEKYREKVLKRAAKTMSAKATIEQREKYSAELDDYAFINPEDFDNIERMRKAVADTPDARKILVGCYPEKSGYYQLNDDLTIKIRPDGINFDNNYLIDLKTVNADAFDDFGKQCVNYKYDVQAGLYLYITSSILGQKWDDFLFIVVEKTPPYRVAVQRSDYIFVRIGSYKAKQGIEAIIRARETGVYRGLVERTLSLPSWEEKKYKNLL